MGLAIQMVKVMIAHYVDYSGGYIDIYLCQLILYVHVKKINTKN